MAVYFLKVKTENRDIQIKCKWYFLQTLAGRQMCKNNHLHFESTQV